MVVGQPGHTVVGAPVTTIQSVHKETCVGFDKARPGGSRAAATAGIPEAARGATGASVATGVIGRHVAPENTVELRATGPTRRVGRNMAGARPPRKGPSAARVAVADPVPAGVGPLRRPMVVGPLPAQVVVLVAVRVGRRAA